MSKHFLWTKKIQSIKYSFCYCFVLSCKPPQYKSSINSVLSSKSMIKYFSGFRVAFSLWKLRATNQQLINWWITSIRNLIEYIRQRLQTYFITNPFNTISTTQVGRAAPSLLTQSSSMSHFYNSWKRQKTKGFPKFSGVIEWGIELNWVNRLHFRLNLFLATT